MRGAYAVAPVVPGLDPGVISLIVILVVHALVGEM